MKKQHLLLISLAAIPMLIGCKPSDQLDEINKLVKANEANIHTCYDAVYTSGVKEKLEKKISDDREYVYDSKAKQFVIMSGDKIVRTSKGYTKSDNTLDYFKFVYTYNPNSNYSQYLLNGNAVSKDLVITTGFDSGSRTDIFNVIYNNLSNKDDNVIIRSYCDYLKIDAPYQTVTHYSDSTNIIVNDIKQLNTCGITSYLKAKKGTINFDPSGETEMFEVEELHEEEVYIKSSLESDVYALVNCKKNPTSPSEHECMVGKVLDKINITSADGFKKECEKLSTAEEMHNLLRLQSDIIFEGSGLSSISINHSLALDLNGFKLSLSDFPTSSSSYINEALRIQSTKEEDRSVYILDSTGINDDHSGIYLNNCSIVLSGVYNETKDISSNLVMNSGKITQTITGESGINKIGAAVTILGNTTEGQEYPRYATFSMRGGKISCNNESKTYDTFGCIGACGLGAIVDVLYGTLTSNEFCIYGNKNENFQLNNAVVNVVGSTLTSTNDSCIYFPLKSSITLLADTLVGATCVNVNSGSLLISESNLTANGTGSYYSTKNYDGSVIYIPKEKFDEDVLSVEVTDSTLLSKFEYITNITEKEGKIPNETSLTFDNGTYTYKRGEGIVANSKTNITKKSGTWTKKEY